MSKLLGLTGLFILTRELTKGVSPQTVVPSTPTNEFGLDDTESEAARIANQKRLDEERKKLQELEAKAKAEKDKRLEDLQFQADQLFIRNNPQLANCSEDRKPVLKGLGTRASPYYWVCELPRFGL
jgi:hypothetical protein